MLCVCLLAAWLLPATDQLTENFTQEHIAPPAQLGLNLSGVRSFSLDQELETRIIGGQEAWAHSWPWQVSLRYVSTPACGGAVIAPTWVVSAAHCFQRSGVTCTGVGGQGGDAQNDVYADDVPDTENRCGRQQNISCDQFPALATVSSPETTTVSSPETTTVSSPETATEALLETATEACPFLWPWHVSLQSSSGRHYCSGALIHRSWVLTAQHCNVRAKKDTVVLGVHDLRFSSSETVPVDKVFNLPKDRSFPPKSDLSLLHLGTPATLSPDVSPVCVPNQDQDLDSTWSCVTTGWRTLSTAEDVDPYRLHHVGLSLVNQTSCSETWGGGLITESHICSHPGGSTACMGDSGAPLVCQKHGVYFLFGVVTWGSRRCDAARPAVFSRVSSFHRWITTVTQDV
ncbi:chymotrypsinogen B-like [Etheostoma cragini]|uniref:chymotrypsinogen B-like n=1 Tax=Etheostoma cragini TaxID=417921 RepID=UPI00155E9583|nr:chymotrypsinogen B-like [Etheostoma cragini]